MSAERIHRSGHRPWGQSTDQMAPVVDGYRRLIARIIQQALKDAISTTDPEERTQIEDFFASGWFETCCTFLRLDVKAVRDELRQRGLLNREAPMTYEAVVD